MIWLLITFSILAAILVTGIMTPSKDLPNEDFEKYPPIKTKYIQLRQISNLNDKIHARTLLANGTAKGAVKYLFENEDFSNQDLKSQYWDRNEFRDATFFNADVSRSLFTWNDFINVDFSFADLRYSDLRASIYENVKFENTDLRGADMRRSSYDKCSFGNALMEGVILTNDYRDQLNLSKKQISEISWTDDMGPEPDGG